MTRHDAEVITGYANPDGSGAGNWSSRAHDADEVIGHLQHYRTRDGRVLMLARRRKPPRPFAAAAPYRHTLRDHLRDIVTILAPYLVAAIWVVAFGLYFTIAGAAQAPRP